MKKFKEEQFPALRKAVVMLVCLVFKLTEMCCATFTKQNHLQVVYKYAVMNLSQSFAGACHLDCHCNLINSAYS